MVAEAMSDANAQAKKSTRPVIVEAGRRVDAPDATTARFPAGNVPKVREKIRQLLTAQKPSAVVSSAACGTDLLLLQAATDMQVPCTVLLPTAPEEFRKSSVTNRPGDWGDIYTDVLRTSQVEMLTLPEGHFLVEEEFGRTVVGDKKVDAPVTVVVGNGNAQRFGGLVQAQLMRHLGEMAVAVVVVNEHRNGWKMIGVAVASIALTMLPTPQVFPVPLDIAFHDQVEQSVIVQVDPRSRGIPAAAVVGRGYSQPRGLGHIGKGAVASAVVETIPSICCYE